MNSLFDDIVYKRDFNTIYTYKPTMEKDMFNVGDFVRYKDQKQYTEFGARRIIKIDTNLIGTRLHFDDLNWNYSELFEKVDTITFNRKNYLEPAMKNEWQFNIVAPEVEIDFKEIAKDVSKHSPVALIHVNDESSFVVIHNMLLLKADVCGMDVESSLGFSMAIIEDNACIYQCSHQDFKDVVEWAKNVKKAKFPEEYRNKATVKVSLPRI